MTSLKAFLTKVVEALRNVLQGEALRLIGYGAVVVVFIVSRILILTGTLVETPSLDSIVAAVTAATVAVVEAARLYVFSPNTVADLLLGTQVATDVPVYAGDTPTD